MIRGSAHRRTRVCLRERSLAFSSTRVSDSSATKAASSTSSTAVRCGRRFSSCCAKDSAWSSRPRNPARAPPPFGTVIPPSMSIAARERLGRALVRTCASVLVVATLAAAAFLPFAGRFLVREDALEPADAILVLAGSRVSRWLEALELYREGRAPLVLLSPGRLERSETALRERGIRLPTEGEIARDAMLQLNVPPDAIRVLAGSLDNTAHEA